MRRHCMEDGKRTLLGDAWRPAAVSTLVLLALLALPSSAFAAFGFESLSSSFAGVGGVTGSLPAGSHPESWTTRLTFSSSEAGGERRVEDNLKELRIELPTGLAAVTGSFPHCPRAMFVEEACPSATAVGSIELTANVELPMATLYLLEPLPGLAAQLGFHTRRVASTIDLSISPRPPYGLIAALTNVSQAVEVFSSDIKLEGRPEGNPFLVLPRSCDEPLQTGFTGSSWQDPGTTVRGTAPEPQSLGGCQSLGYSPVLNVAPTTTAAASPTAFDVTVDVPDQGLFSPAGRATADTRAATVTLPPGLTINPPIAAGLVACTPAELAAEEPDSQPGQGCPKSSKLGTATVTTPLFSEALEGTVYLALPAGSDSPIVSGASSSRFTLELVLRDAERGVLVALPINVDADARSGRLTASFEEIPPLPISHLEMHLNSGGHAPLTTPATCGPHSIDYSLTPSSGNPPLSASQSFVTFSSECSPGFHPALSAGTVSSAAGHSSAFVLELSGGAAAPNPAGFDVSLPPGLSASFAAASVCPEPQVAGGDCPTASKLGYARIAVGTGPEPLWIPLDEDPDSAVYLAGPYKGAPYSLLIVVPAQAGPFDLGDVILRAPITIDPSTAQADVSIEELPQILAGVPLHYRALRVVLDRPGFIRNPTSCETAEITGTARSAEGGSASLADRFQAADCAALPFRPKLQLTLSGPVGRNGHPNLRATLRNDVEGAALKSAAFALPAGELLDLRRIRELCPREAPVGGCPRASQLGSVRLFSPSLQAPIEGPIYLRVPDARLPALAGELRSGGLRFLLHGRTTDAEGHFGVTLTSLPDIPISRAVLDLPGGRRGIVVNSRSLCRGRGEVTATLNAHSGKRRHLKIRPKVAGC
jgi:hypothetical protein